MILLLKGSHKRRINDTYIHENMSVSNVAYVTALYDIYHRESVSDRLRHDVAALLHSGIPLILFVDATYQEIIQDLHPGPHIQIVLEPLTNIHTYMMLVGNKDGLHLPIERTPEKDTHEYMALMNSKIEFMDRARQFTACPYIAWIDAGVSKMLKHPAESFQRLREAHIEGVERMLIPGCYRTPRSVQDLCKNVWWVFIGTFLLGHRDYIPHFYSLSLQTVAKFMLKRYAVWEVNVWVDLWQRHPESITWYYSDHDDTFTSLGS